MGQTISILAHYPHLAAYLIPPERLALMATRTGRRALAVGKSQHNSAPARPAALLCWSGARAFGLDST